MKARGISMGTFGKGIFDNDVALDVKDRFLELFSEGKTASEINETLLKEFSSEMNDTDDSIPFWLALADIEWQHGILFPEVKSKALECLEDVKNQSLLEAENANFTSSRLKVFDKLRVKLNSPQPKAKKYRVRIPYKCDWKMFDVFAYPLESDDAKVAGLLGGYILLSMVGETKFLEWVVPVCAVKLVLPDQFTYDLSELDKLPYTKVDSPRRGFPDCLFVMDNITKRRIPKKLIYIGNNPNMTLPENLPNEFHYKDIRHVAWKIFEFITLRMIVISKGNEEQVKLN